MHLGRDALEELARRRAFPWISHFHHVDAYAPFRVAVSRQSGDYYKVRVVRGVEVEGKACESVVNLEGREKQTINHRCGIPVSVTFAGQLTACGLPCRVLSKRSESLGTLAFSARADLANSLPSKHPDEISRQ